VLTPRITQQTLEVHAAIAFGSVIVGGILFGATGALLAIPVVATVLSVMDAYGRRYELVPELKSEMEPSVDRT
jgi:predicted PurR-regulated permease PerM